MSQENENHKENSNENIQNNDSSKDAYVKKHRKEKKSIRKSSKAGQDQVKVIPLLKPPSKRRKFDKNGRTTNQDNNSQTGIIWDNKTIEEQYLDRKLHPRIKIDEPKTPYPDGDDDDLYQEGMNKVNETKPTEKLLNDVVASLNEKDNKNNKSNTGELKKKAYSNEYTKALKFYKENEKFDDLTGERKLCLQNTLINKFHKEVRSLSKGRTHDNN